MTSYATQMWWLMMIGFALGSFISLFAARVLLPKLKNLQAYDATRAAGDDS